MRAWNGCVDEAARARLAAHERIYAAWREADAAARAAEERLCQALEAAANGSGPAPDAQQREEVRRLRCAACALVDQACAAMRATPL